MSDLYDGRDLAILYGVPSIAFMAAIVVGGDLGRSLMAIGMILVLFIALGTANNLHRRIEQLETRRGGDRAAN